MSVYRNMSTVASVGLACILLLTSTCAEPSPTPTPPSEQPPPQERPPGPTQPSPVTLNPVEEYVNSLGLPKDLVSKLKPLGEDEVMDENEKALIDLAVVYYPKVNQILPGFYGEIMKLPDLSVIDEKDVEAVEDILVLASNAEYKAAFESMMDEGIRDKRKYCSPLEALLWIAYDREFDGYDPLSNYSLTGLIDNAWKNTTTSDDYTSERWQDFDEIADRLSLPELVATYCIDNFRWESHEWYELQSTGTLEEVWSPLRTFILRKGACYDQSAFALHCLIRHGYSYDDFEVHKNHAACVLCASGRSLGLGDHYVCLYIEDGQFYTIDVGTPYVRGIKGPFRTVEQAADATLPGCMEYTFFNRSGMPTKQVPKER